jgi:hypothetical protein
MASRLKASTDRKSGIFLSSFATHTISRPTVLVLAQHGNLLDASRFSP